MDSIKTMDHVIFYVVVDDDDNNNYIDNNAYSLDKISFFSVNNKQSFLDTFVMLLLMMMITLVG